MTKIIFTSVIFLYSSFFSILFALSPLTTIENFSTNLKNIDYILLDIRDNSSFVKGHIEGSISAPYHKFRGTKDTFISE